MLSTHLKAFRLLLIIICANNYRLLSVCFSHVLLLLSCQRSGLVKEKIDQVKTAQVLILDDIGAEQSSPWMRDEILQVILQHRMQENLPTFFTSNFSFADLERHFASSKNGDETWQAKRVMERIKFLAQEVRLEGENRR